MKLTGIPGVDLEFDDVEYEVTELADGLAAVEIVGGKATAGTVIPDEVPIGAELPKPSRTSAARVDIEAEPTGEDIADGEIILVAVDDDGWHISLGYTIAEFARVVARASRCPTSDDDRARRRGLAGGGRRELADAAAELDLRRRSRSVDPSECAALHDYAPLFLDDADEALAEEDDLPEVTISTLETSASVDGDVATVAITAIEATDRGRR